MKWFYVIAIVIAGILGAAPLYLLGPGDGELPPGETVYRVTYSSAVKSIDPATCGDVASSSVQANIFEGLYGYKYLKRPVEVTPQLAVAMPQISDSGCRYTIRVKKGVYYHRNPCFGKAEDGNAHRWATREVTAYDFVLAIKRIADYHLNTGLAWAFLAGRIKGLDAYRQKTTQYKSGDFSRYEMDVEGIAVPDSHTLQIDLNAPYPQFVYVLAMHVYAPIPHEAIDYWLMETRDGSVSKKIPVAGRSVEFQSPDHAIGTGPYILESWKRKWKIRLRKNPEYRTVRYPTCNDCSYTGYVQDSARGLYRDAGKKIPFIDRIHFRFMEENYPRWMLFLTKQKDVASIPKETFNSVITPEKELAQKWREKGIYLERFTEPSIFWIAFNMEDRIIGESRALRRAISLGYNVESEIEVLFNGRGTRPVNIIPETFKGHSQAGKGEYFRFDTTAARAQLELARKQLAEKGLLEDGKIPTLHLDLSKGAFAMRIAEFARHQFSRLGIDIKVSFNDWPTLQRKVHNKQSQMYMMGWAADYPDAENFLQLFYSANIDKGTNNTNFSNAEFDSLYRMVRRMQDSPQRTRLYGEMARIINREVPILPRLAPENFILYHSWVHNVKPHPISQGNVKYYRIDRSEIDK